MGLGFCFVFVFSQNSQREGMGKDNLGAKEGSILNSINITQITKYQKKCDLQKSDYSKHILKRPSSINIEDCRKPYYTCNENKAKD